MKLKGGRPRKQTTGLGIDDRELLNKLGISKEECIRSNLIRRLIRKLKLYGKPLDLVDRKLTNLAPMMPELNAFLSTHHTEVLCELNDWNMRFRVGRMHQQPNLAQQRSFMEFGNLRKAYDCFVAGISQLDFDLIKKEFKLKHMPNEGAFMLQSFVSSSALMKDCKISSPTSERSLSVPDTTLIKRQTSQSLNSDLCTDDICDSIEARANITDPCMLEDITPSLKRASNRGSSLCKVACREELNVTLHFE